MEQKKYMDDKSAEAIIKLVKNNGGSTNINPVILKTRAELDNAMITGIPFIWGGYDIATDSSDEFMLIPGKLYAYKNNKWYKLSDDSIETFWENHGIGSQWFPNIYDLVCQKHYIEHGEIFIPGFNTSGQLHVNKKVSVNTVIGIPIEIVYIADGLYEYCFCGYIFPNITDSGSNAICYDHLITFPEDNTKYVPEGLYKWCKYQESLGLMDLEHVLFTINKDATISNIESDDPIKQTDNTLEWTECLAFEVEEDNELPVTSSAVAEAMNNVETITITSVSAFEMQGTSNCKKLGKVVILNMHGSLSTSLSTDINNPTQIGSIPAAYAPKSTVISAANGLMDGSFRKIGYSIRADGSIWAYGESPSSQYMWGQLSWIIED